MNFDMNAVWARGIELVRDNFSLLLVIAGTFLLLPTVAMYLFVPEFQTFADPTADPEILAERRGELLAPLAIGGLLASIVQFAGYGAMVALMGRGRPTVGQAIAHGFTLVPSLFAVLIVFLLAYIAGTAILVVPFALIAGASGSGALAVLAIPLVLIWVAWLGARMSLTLPVMVIEQTRNPFAAIARSFRLTRADQWKIALFWVVLVVAFTIISVLFNGVFGVIAALVGTGTAALLIAGLANGVTGMVSGMLTSALGVAIYDRLAVPPAGDIEQVFD